MRITAKRLRARLALINRVLGRPLTPWNGTTANIGFLYLYHNGHGYQVLETVNESGGVSTMYPAMSAGELFAVLGGFLDGIKYRKTVDEVYASGCGF
jgi:hypothetical protein